MIENHNLITCYFYVAPIEEDQDLMIFYLIFSTNFERVLEDYDIKNCYLLFFPCLKTVEEDKVLMT